MRILKFCAVLAVGVVVLGSQVYAQFNCNQLADPGKTPQNLRGALKLGNSDATDDDIFNCGGQGAETPATCELFNRFYTDSESACINADTIFNTTLPPQDYLPNAFGSGQGRVNFQYETDIMVPANWPRDFGGAGESWYMVWDHLAVNPLDPADCAGFYAAGGDSFTSGEQGLHFRNSCNCTLSSCVAGSCWDPPRPVLADVCNPQTPDFSGPDPLTNIGGDAPGPTLTNIGGLAPVPVPVVAALNPSNTDFSAAGSSASLSWRTACAFTTHETAPSPGMGYRIEARVDASGDGACNPATACDADSTDEWFPVLDIAPDPDMSDAVADTAGDIATNNATVAFASLQSGTSAAISTWECVQFRLRILFTDDRVASAGTVGGRDTIINPVISLPSRPRPFIANQAALPALISSFVGNKGAKGNQVDLEWRVGNDSFTRFRISKSDSRNGNFIAVGEVPGQPGQLDYSLTDSKAKSHGAGKGNAIWYRLQADGPGGFEEAFVAVPVERGKKDK